MFMTIIPINILLLLQL